MNKPAGLLIRTAMTAALFLASLAGGCNPTPGGADGARMAPRDPSAPAETGRAGSDEYAAAREKMVLTLQQTFKDQRDFSGMQAALDAMRRVPRHEFVNPRHRSRAYDVDRPLPIEEDQTISAPDIVAVMTGSLNLKGARRVLEIGTGSGYQAAVLGELVPEVYSIEIRPGLAESARKKIEELKSKGVLGSGKIQVIQGDGYQGYAAMAPYDAIVVTAAPKAVPVNLLNQLKVGGQMVIPVGDFYQQLQLIERNAEGAPAPFTYKMLLPVRFVPMVNEQTRLDGAEDPRPRK